VVKDTVEEVLEVVMTALEMSRAAAVGDSPARPHKADAQ
jgi:hypothetical protein